MLKKKLLSRDAIRRGHGPSRNFLGQNDRPDSATPFYTTTDLSPTDIFPPQARDIFEDLRKRHKNAPTDTPKSPDPGQELDDPEMERALRVLNFLTAQKWGDGPDEDGSDVLELGTSIEKSSALKNALAAFKQVENDSPRDRFEHVRNAVVQDIMEHGQTLTTQWLSEVQEPKLERTHGYNADDAKAYYADCKSFDRLLMATTPLPTTTTTTTTTKAPPAA